VSTSRILAPIIPFATEKMHQELVRHYDPSAPVSVHLCDFPQPVTDAAVNDQKLVHAMDAVLDLVEQGHAARNRAGLKVRQPLAEMRVEAAEPGLPDQMSPFQPLILDELNIKKITFVASAADLFTLSVRLDARTGKPKFGKLFAPLQEALAALPADQAACRAREAHGLSLQVDGQAVTLLSEDIVVEKLALKPWEISEGNGFLVAISTQLDEALVREGCVRDLVRHIQNLRKQTGLDVADRIRIEYVAGNELAAAVAAHVDYLAGETLALEIQRCDGALASAHAIELGGESIHISISKV
jgi:isoleucyl-tRNA synthetase